MYLTIGRMSAAGMALPPYLARMGRNTSVSPGMAMREWELRIIRIKVVPDRCTPSTKMGPAGPALLRFINASR